MLIFFIHILPRRLQDYSFAYYIIQIKNKQTQLRCIEKLRPIKKIMSIEALSFFVIYILNKILLMLLWKERLNSVILWRNLKITRWS